MICTVVVEQALEISKKNGMLDHVAFVERIRSQQVSWVFSSVPPACLR